MKKIYNVADHYPIIVSEYPFHKELKKELIPLLENYPDEMGKRTNVKATMTEYVWGDNIKRVSRLKSFIVEMAGRIAMNPNLVGDLKVRHLWANIYEHYDYTISHDHVGIDILSFAYFLKGSKRSARASLLKTMSSLYKSGARIPASMFKARRK